MPSRQAIWLWDEDACRALLHDVATGEPIPEAEWPGCKVCEYADLTCDAASQSDWLLSGAAGGGVATKEARISFADMAVLPEAIHGTPSTGGVYRDYPISDPDQAHLGDPADVLGGQWKIAPDNQPSPQNRPADYGPQLGHKDNTLLIPPCLDENARNIRIKVKGLRMRMNPTSGECTIFPYDTGLSVAAGNGSTLTAPWAIDSATSSTASAGGCPFANLHLCSEGTDGVWEDIELEASGLTPADVASGLLVGLILDTNEEHCLEIDGTNAEVVVCWECDSEEEIVDGVQSLSQCTMNAIAALLLPLLLCLQGMKVLLEALLAKKSQPGIPTLFKNKLLLFGLENTSLSWRYEYLVRLPLGNGSFRECLLPASTGWGPQMIAWEAALKDCFPEACLVARHWADWKANQLPQSGAGSIPQTSFATGNNFAPPLTGQYIEFQFCPSDAGLMPVGAEVIGTTHPDRLEYILKSLVGETKEETNTICLSCDPDCTDEIPKCAILATQDWPETPDPLCTFDSQDGCDNLGWIPDPEDPDADPPDFPKVTRVFTFCQDGTRIAEYLIEDDDGNLDEYNNGLGLVGELVDCTTLEVIQEPEAPTPPCTSVPVTICGKAPKITDTLKGYKWNTQGGAIDTAPPPAFEASDYVDAFSSTDGDGLPWHPNPFDECISLSSAYLNESDYGTGTNHDQLVMEGYLYIPVGVTAISLQTYGAGYSYEAIHAGPDPASSPVLAEGVQFSSNTPTTKPIDLTGYDPDPCLPEFKCLFVRVYSNDSNGLGRIQMRVDVGNGFQSTNAAGIRLSETKEVETYSRVEWVPCGEQPKLALCEEVGTKICGLDEILGSGSDEEITLGEKTQSIETK